MLYDDSVTLGSMGSFFFCRFGLHGVSKIRILRKLRLSQYPSMSMWLGNVGSSLCEVSLKVSTLFLMFQLGEHKAVPFCIRSQPCQIVTLHKQHVQEAEPIATIDFYTENII